jgi:hypothetical protein
MITSAMGVGILELAKQQISDAEASWFLIFGVVVMHAFKLILIALAIAAAILLFQGPRNQSKE